MIPMQPVYAPIFANFQIILPSVINPVCVLYYPLSEMTLTWHGSTYIPMWDFITKERKAVGQVRGKQRTWRRCYRQHPTTLSQQEARGGSGDSYSSTWSWSYWEYRNGGSREMRSYFHRMHAAKQREWGELCSSCPPPLPAPWPWLGSHFFTFFLKKSTVKIL